MKKILFIFLILFCFTLNPSAKIKSFDIQYNVNDPEGRCGNPKKNNCASVANIEYTSGKMTYYMQKQLDAEGLIIDGSCRAHALMSAINALNDTKYSTLDLQNFLKKSSPYDGILKSYNFESAFEHFKVDAKVYHSDIKNSKIISLINEAFSKDEPVILFVRGATCPDVAGTNHALLLLGTDSDNNVVFTDSTNRYPNAKKRTVKQLVEECRVSKGTGNSYFTVLTFPNSNKSYTGGSVTDPYGNFIPDLETSDDFTCKTIFIDQYGEKTELKKILDDIFNLIQIITPIITIILTIIDYYKTLTKLGDTKKTNLRTIKRIVIATIIVFLPLLLELLFHLFGLYDLSTCEIGK